MVLIAVVARPYAALHTDDSATITVKAKPIFHMLLLITLITIGSTASAVFQACNAQSVGAVLNCIFLVVMSLSTGLLIGLPLRGGLHGLCSDQLIGATGVILAPALWAKRFDWHQQALEASGGEKTGSARECSMMDIAAGSVIISVVYVLDPRPSTSCILGDEEV